MAWEKSANYLMFLKFWFNSKQRKKDKERQGWEGVTKTLPSLKKKEKIKSNMTWFPVPTLMHIAEEGCRKITTTANIAILKWLSKSTQVP